MIKVMIADDQELIRESLKIVLNTHDDLKVVATAADGVEVLRLLKNLAVDIILMDIRMPNMDGVVCTRLVKETYPETKIIILTTFDDDDFVFSALRYGASGYLLKGVGMEELHQAILTVKQGGAMINPDIAMKVFNVFSKMSQDNYAIQVEQSQIESISKPEWRVIQQVGYGMSNREISEKLCLSEGTVRNYLSSILSKLNLRDRTQLAIWAVQSGQTATRFDYE